MRAAKFVRLPPLWNLRRVKLMHRTPEITTIINKNCSNDNIQTKKLFSHESSNNVTIILNNIKQKR